MLQEQQFRNVVALRKVAGLGDPSDLLTKHLIQESVDHYCELIGHLFAAGRASSTCGLRFCRGNVSSLSLRDIDATRRDIELTRRDIDATPRQREPNRYYGCGGGFRFQNRLHTHLAGGDCEDTLLNDTCHARRRGSAISTVATKLSMGRTSPVPIENRGRAISTHRMDVFDIAPSRNVSPYLQSQLFQII